MYWVQVSLGYQRKQKWVREERVGTILDSAVSEWASLVAQLVKNPPAMQVIPVQFLGQDDPLEKR